MRSGSRPRTLASRHALGLLALLALSAGGCIGNLPQPTPSLAVSTPTPNAAIAATRDQVEAALRTAGFGLLDYRGSYQPPETPALAAAPIAVYRIVLPQDPSHGALVVWDLGSPGAAASAGRDYAAYLASGPIRVEFPPDTRFALRQLGSTLVFYSFSAASSSDPTGGKATDALETVGQGIAIG